MGRKPSVSAATQSLRILMGGHRVRCRYCEWHCAPYSYGTHGMVRLKCHVMSLHKYEFVDDERLRKLKLYTPQHGQPAGYWEAAG